MSNHIDGYYNIGELSRKPGLRTKGKFLTRAGIHLAIKQGRLKAKKINRLWYVCEYDLEMFLNQKYDRHYRKTKDNKRIFDASNGTFTVEDTVKIINEKLVQLSKQGVRLKSVNRQSLYYHIKIGKLPCMLHGGSKVIREKDINIYLKNLYDEKQEKLRLAK